ncbi:MAG: ANTAR domain-containing protein [Mycobacteriaceae bacterium]
MHATDPVIAHLDELQFTLAEGPCLDAYGAVAAVLVEDLRGESSRTRWPVFALEASAAGAAAVFAFPLVTGAVCFGVLELYRRTPGLLAAEAQQTAGVAVEALTKVALTELFGPESDLEISWPARLTVEHAEVHQAAGMVAVHLATSVPDAMARLRATAYTQNTSLTELAHRVLSGQARLDKDPCS